MGGGDGVRWEEGVVLGRRRHGFRWEEGVVLDGRRGWC